MKVLVHFCLFNKLSAQKYEKQKYLQPALVLPFQSFKTKQNKSDDGLL